jgi:hypothetical protein
MNSPDQYLQVLCTFGILRSKPKVQR